VRSKSPCAEFESGLVAAATGEAEPAAARRVHAHLERCSGCRAEFEGYRAVEAAVGAMRIGLPEGPDVTRSRERLESRLADLKSRLVAYRIFPSPFGYILIARSEQGVLLVDYLGAGRSVERSRLARLPGVEPVEDGAEVDTLYRDLRQYLEGRLTRLDWPLDLRLVRSAFHRRVLEVTAAIPYGAVVSYSGLARDVGRPRAVRAAAQALRWNPLPIVIPCHRVVGVTGALTGYAGGKPTRKEKLLSVEGVPMERAGGDVRVARDAMYVLAPGDTAYCLPTCPSADPAAPPAYAARAFPIGGVLFGSRVRAEAMGLTPCTTCRPDLHPLSA
jgi:methylated-DNA-[protein]-cysteine S-methyltransferase